MENTISIDNLKSYAESNEVVFQFCGELMAVSNDKEKENKRDLLRYLNRANLIIEYDKRTPFISENWPELSGWSTEDDALFLLDGIGVLICIPKKEAIANNIIEA